MASKARDAGKVQAHPLVEALNPDPSQPPRRTLTLLGLPGPSPSPDQTRLWLDTGLTSYVDVPDMDILHSRALPEDAGTVLWVAAEAELTYGSVTSHATQAAFLAGTIASTHLAGAAAAEFVPPGVTPTPPLTFASACLGCPTQSVMCPTHQGQCLVTLPACPSEAMAPSHCGPCPTHTGPCLSLPFCPSEAMAPSHCGVCNTHAPLCQPPSAACPSAGHLMCPTPSAVGRCGSQLGCPSWACQ